MTHYPLSESFSVIADWYLPERQDEIITGTLSYSSDGISLLLEDSFQPVEGVVHGGEMLQLPAIYGVSRAGESFTLINPMRVGFNLSFGPTGSIQPDRFYAPLLLRGIHSDAKTTFPELSCRVPGLDIWLSRPTIEPQFGNGNASDFMGFRIRTLPAETFRIPAISASLEFDVVSSTTLHSFSASVTTLGSWRLVPDSPQSLAWYLEQIVSLSSFLSLCAGVPMGPDGISVPTTSMNDRASVLVSHPNPKYCSLSQHHEFFLTRGGFAESFDKCLSHWFDIYPKIEIPCRLATDILASDELWPYIEFLSLMQALEGFHRSLYDGRYMDEKDYKHVEQALVKSIPTEIAMDHRDSLKSRIRYGNEIALARRLQTLSERLSDLIRSLIFGDSAKLPRNWVDTRNYYTHWDDNLKPNILSGQDIIYANARLRAFLRVLYLEHVGIPQAWILRALRGFSSEAQFLIQIRGVERRARNPDDTTGAFMWVDRTSPEPGPD